MSIHGIASNILASATQAAQTVHASSPADIPENQGGHETRRNFMRELLRHEAGLSIFEKLKKPIALLLMSLFAPIVKPFEIVNTLSNHTFSRLLPGLPDGMYGLAYKVVPTGFISKAASKIGLGAGISDKASGLIISAMNKAGIKGNDTAVKAFVQELTKGLSDIYNPQFLKQFDHFFLRVLKEGERPYEEMAEVLLERAMEGVGETVSNAIFKATNEVEESATEAVAGAVDKAKALKDAAVSNVKNAATQVNKTATGMMHAGRDAAHNAKESAAIAAKGIEEKALGKGGFAQILEKISDLIKKPLEFFGPKKQPTSLHPKMSLASALV